MPGHKSITHPANGGLGESWASAGAQKHRGGDVRDDIRVSGYLFNMQCLGLMMINEERFQDILELVLRETMLESISLVHLQQGFVAC